MTLEYGPGLGFNALMNSQIDHYSVTELRPPHSVRWFSRYLNGKSSFRPMAFGAENETGAVTIEISLTETVVSLSDSLARQTERPLSESAVSIPAESMTREVRRLLSESAISILIETVARAVQRQLSEASISIPAETLSREVERSLSEPPLSFADSLIRMISVSLSEPSISFSDSIQVEVIPIGPPAGKRWRVHVSPVTPIHTPKVM